MSELIPIDFIPDGKEEEMFSGIWPQVPRAGEGVSLGDAMYTVVAVSWGFRVSGLLGVLQDKPCVTVALKSAKAVDHVQGDG